MLRSLFLVCLLTLLTAGGRPLSAHPAARAWWFWLRRPERHGSRKMAGDFRPIYSTYRNHSRRDEGPFHFLHFARHRHEALAHRYSPQPHSLARHRFLSL